MAKPLVAVFSLLLLSAVIWRVASKRKSHKLSPHMLSSDRLSSPNERAPLSIDDGIISKYLEDLADENEKMNTAWASSEAPVKAAFQKYFAPPLENGQALTHDPLKTINDHVAKMLACQFPSDSTAIVRSDFLQHVRALHTICRIATLRLEELKLLYTYQRGLGVPGGFLFHEEPHSNSDLEYPVGSASLMKSDDSLLGVGIVDSEREQSEEGEVSGEKYLKVPRSSDVREGRDMNSDTDSSMMPDEFLDSMQMLGNMQKRPVNRNLARTLTLLLVEDERLNISNMAARYYFERFLQPFGESDPTNAVPSTAKHQIPYSGQPFRTGALAKAAAQIFRQSEGDTNYARVSKIYRIADNWSSEGVLQATEQQGRENAYRVKQQMRIKRERMRVLLKEGIQMDDLEMIALFLL